MPYKRPGENFYRAKITIGGQQRELLRHPDFDVCKALEDKVKAEIKGKAELLGNPDLLTVAAYREHRWLQENPRPADNTHRAMMKGTRLFASDAEFGRSLLVELDGNRRELAAWFQTGPGKEWMRVHVKGLLEDAKDAGLIDENPLQDTKRRRRRRGEPKRGVKPHPPITPDLIDPIATAAGRLFGPSWAALIRFVAVQGLRTGELAALEWDDIDFHAGTVNVRRQVTVDGIRPPKWGSMRVITLFNDGRAGLGDVPRMVGSDRVWHSVTGRELDPDAIRRMWARIRRAAGLHPQTPIKALRAHAATRLRTLGASDLEIEHLLGEKTGSSEEADPAKAVVRKHLGHTQDDIQDKHYVDKWEPELNDGLRRLDKQQQRRRK